MKPGADVGAIPARLSLRARGRARVLHLGKPDAKLSVVSYIHTELIDFGIFRCSILVPKLERLAECRAAFCAVDTQMVRTERLG